jgi:hypothetical protein
LSAADNVDDSMISFWSTTGTEGLHPTNHPAPKRKDNRDELELELINLKEKFKRLERENQALHEKLAVQLSAVGEEGERKAIGDITTSNDAIQHHPTDCSRGSDVLDYPLDDDRGSSFTTTNIMHQIKEASTND